MANPFIMVAPNGARRSKADHTEIPISISETVDTAVACYAAGAQGIHLHIRDEAGRHSLDSGRYLEALGELNSAVPDLRVQITTESADLFDTSQQLACLEQVRPDWASVSIREIARNPALADRIYGTCAANGTAVQHILYDTQDVELLKSWQAQGIVRPDQTGVIYVLGRYSKGQASDPADLMPFLDADEGRESWMVCAFGRYEHQCLLAAAAFGGDLRVGFENSLNGTDGLIYSDNGASVAALNRRLQGIAA